MVSNSPNLSAIPNYHEPPKHPIIQAIKKHLDNQGIQTHHPPITINYPRFDTKTHIIYYNEFTHTIRIRNKTDRELKQLTEINPSDPNLLTIITQLHQ